MTRVNSKVSDILREKGSKVYDINDSNTVFDAVEKMTSNGVGSLIVKSGEEVVGIVTERDYLRKVIVVGKASKETAVKDIMSKELIVAEPDETVDQLLAVMTEKRIRHLPVIDKGKLVGLVSIGDLTKQIVRDQKATIHYLNDYITDKYPA